MEWEILVNRYLSQCDMVATWKDLDDIQPVKRRYKPYPTVRSPRAEGKAKINQNRI